MAIRRRLGSRHVRCADYRCPGDLCITQPLGKWVLKRHTRGRDDYPGTGAELADHLLRRLGIEGASVERTEFGDHYDPETRCVRLSPDNYDGRSLTAVTVAAHEVGHALQHFEGYAPLLARSRLVKVAQKPKSWARY